MMMTERKQRKLIASAISLILCFGVMMGGTFAWQSISQEALNEVASKAINPGGRLHDDFDARDIMITNKGDKDVYVENFGDEPIYARIKMTEYMEIGADAGKDLGNANRDVEVVTEVAYEQKENWPVHSYHNEENKTNPYWKWVYGGQTVYMPTFNKNGDSLAADINGTFAQNYADHVDYTVGQTVTMDAKYDADTNDLDEGATSVAEVNHYVVEETHTAAQTLNGSVISMSQWRNDYQGQGGDFWVYDGDGWAYWANPIQPGEATGLLLSSIEMNPDLIELKNRKQDWYYAINVVGQFVTAGDVGNAEEGTGFYDTTAGKAPSDSAVQLLTAIGAFANGEPEQANLLITDGIAIEGNEGSTVIPFSMDARTVQMKFTGEDAADVQWALVGNTTSSIDVETGLITIAENEQADILTVQATVTAESGEQQVATQVFGIEYEKIPVSAASTQSLLQEETVTFTLGDGWTNKDVEWKISDPNGIINGHFAKIEYELTSNTATVTHLCDEEEACPCGKAPGRYITVTVNHVKNPKIVGEVPQLLLVSEQENTVDIPEETTDMKIRIGEQEYANGETAQLSLDGTMPNVIAIGGSGAEKWLIKNDYTFIAEPTISIDEATQSVHLVLPEFSEQAQLVLTALNEEETNSCTITIVATQKAAAEDQSGAAIEALTIVYDGMEYAQTDPNTTIDLQAGVNHVFSVKENVDSVVWTVSGAAAETTAFEGNMLSIAADETSTDMVITATVGAEGQQINCSLSVNVIDSAD